MTKCLRLTRTTTSSLTSSNTCAPVFDRASVTDFFFLCSGDDKKPEEKKEEQQPAEVKKEEKEEDKQTPAPATTAPDTSEQQTATSADPRLAFAPPPAPEGGSAPQPVAPPSEQQQQQAATAAAALAAANQQAAQHHISGGISTGNIYIPPKDEGKMFIGGLNWETTDDSLRNYFNQFGEVIDCTVMRDNATGRSRGFGFLTFKEPHCVTEVLKKEHFLDGKIIDPKRAIPREEQDKTAKIFVGGVGSDVNEEDFKNFFEQYGTVIDAQLMIDKDTGRPRGFGFVTFDSDQAVERIVSEKFLILKGKPIEVKKAEPRTKGADGQLQPESRAAPQNNYMNGMNPAMMSQYLQRWQAYMSQFQQMMMQQQNQQGGSSGGQMGMNPQMMAQMNPQMMQQMAQMNPQMAQMMQQQQPQQQQQSSYNGYDNNNSHGDDNNHDDVPGYVPEEEDDYSYRDRDRGYHRGRWNRSRRDRSEEGSSRSDSASNRRSRSPPYHRGGGRRGSGQRGSSRSYRPGGSSYHPYRG